MFPIKLVGNLVMVMAHGRGEEAGYDRRRLAQWLAGTARGDGVSRRSVLRLAAAGAAGTVVTGATLGVSAPASGDSPIIKPLPPEWFDVYGSNAEMRWDAMAGQGYLVPIDRFFVRDHTSTPLLDAGTWRLKVFGSGLRGSPTLDQAVEFSCRQLRRLPASTLTAFVECAGNGRSFFASQQNQSVSGTAWKLGAVGVARWRGVRLSTVLTAAGITGTAVDVMAQGLDPDYVTGGVDLGPVRRPLPIRKALHDVLLAYEMNDEPLPPDHGFPVRLIVPGWIGVASIKWLGQLEVSATPLFSPWNTQFYRLFGPDYPTDGTLVTSQVVKSAFELGWNATLPTGREHVLRGPSWSGHGPIARVEVSTDGGTRWRRATPVGTATAHGWQRWQLRWRPDTTGPHTLRARATDVTGTSQPDQATYNTLGYLFDAVVAHPVSVV
jgi:DMSO/TMAO reductase YedYZ molybdopterin-dependent catalytic subunit